MSNAFIEHLRTTASEKKRLCAVKTYNKRNWFLVNYFFLKYIKWPKTTLVLRFIEKNCTFVFEKIVVF